MSTRQEDRMELEEFIQDLPQEKSFLSGMPMYQYQGFWVPKLFMEGLLAAQKNFVAQDDDIILVSSPKSGTTWLKALGFSIMNRSTLSNSPLLEENPHEIVPNLEFLPQGLRPPTSETDGIKFPRIFGAHMSYDSLPASIKTSGCKIVFIYRNPMDQLISFWHFEGQLGEANQVDIEEWFERFCAGKHFCGPFWSHVLGYWKASLENPEKILMLKYEDLVLNSLSSVKRLAEFLGFPFSEDEEKRGVVQEILDFCSIGKLKALEVNKIGKRPYGVPYSAYFRKGEVGDFKNFLNPHMVERMEKLMQEMYGDHYLALR